MAVPYWRDTPEGQAQLNQDEAARMAGAAAAAGIRGGLSPAQPLVMAAVRPGQATWEQFWVNGRNLPGIVRVIKAPSISLQEIASKGKNKDTQIRTVRGLKSAPFVVRCLLLSAQDWTDWQEIQPILLPVTNPNGRGEVRLVSHPIVQAVGITHAFVTTIDPALVPDGGGPAAYDITFQSWWPNMASGAHSKVDRNPKDPQQTQTPIIDVAQTVPVVPQLSYLQRPTPARNQ